MVTQLKKDKSLSSKKKNFMRHDSRSFKNTSTVLNYDLTSNTSLILMLELEAISNRITQNSF